MKKITISFVFLTLFVLKGICQSSYWKSLHSPSNMHIILMDSPYVYLSPDTMGLPGSLYYIRIQDFINELSIPNDIHISHVSGNRLFNRGLYIPGGGFDSLSARAFYGKFFFTGSSDIGIDSGIILNSGFIIYGGAYLYPIQTPGPGQDPGVCWPANIYSSGPNYGVNNVACQSVTIQSTARDTQYAQLVAINNGDSIWDANVMNFDFVPKGRYIKLAYVFGSEEYGQPGGSCAYPTDVMGIFLSGPGITGSKNIAVLPGTNTPVNPHTVYPSHSPCQGEDTAASPYYVDNTNGQNIAYDGFTKVLQAFAKVTPCDTYHLRVAVADGAVHPNDTTYKIIAQQYGNSMHEIDSMFGSAGRMLYDSGLMLKFGSFRSTDSLWLTAIGGVAHTAAHPYAVRGCLSGAIRLHAATPWPIARTFHLSYQGSAVNGNDYQWIADSVTLPANDTFVDITVTPMLPLSPSGVKTLKALLVSPFGSCYQMNPAYLDTTTLYISNGYWVGIRPQDTTICTGCNFTFDVNGEDFMTYSWSPATGLSNPNIKNPTASPSATTHYVLTATPDAAHTCPGSKDSTWVYVGIAGIGSNATNDQALSVFPNPFGKGFRLHLEGAGQKPFQLVIYNISGEKVYQNSGTISQLNKGLTAVGQRLAPGNYLLELSNKEGFVYRKKMVKQ